LFDGQWLARSDPIQKFADLSWSRPFRRVASELIEPDTVTDEAESIAAFFS
jgi:hypothetical protein